MRGDCMRSRRLSRRALLCGLLIHARLNRLANDPVLCKNGSTNASFQLFACISCMHARSHRGETATRAAVRRARPCWSICVSIQGRTHDLSLLACWKALCSLEVPVMRASGSPFVTPCHPPRRSPRCWRAHETRRMGGATVAWHETRRADLVCARRPPRRPLTPAPRPRDPRRDLGEIRAAAGRPAPVRIFRGVQLHSVAAPNFRAELQAPRGGDGYALGR
jgi:hypothetical protein